MDFLNQTAAQLRDLFASMTPAARITAALLLAVVVVSLGFLFQQTTAGPDEYLFGAERQSSSKIARMEAAMASAGITGFAVDGNRIRVPRAQKEAAIAAIANAGELPADVFRFMDEALDRGSVFDSGEVKRQRMQAAREKQLSHIITLMPWVDQAIVTCHEEASTGLRRTRRASVAVSIQPAAGELVTSRRARNVKSFAARSCGVAMENVSVVDIGGGAVAGGDGIDPDDFDHPQIRLKTKVERDLRQNLVDQLSFIPGVRVQVKAVLDDTKASRTIEVKPDQAAVQLQTQLVEEETEQNRNAGGGRPGLEANGPGRAGPDAALANRDTSKTRRSDESSQNVVGSKTEEITKWDSTLQEAYASVAIPRSHVQNIYRLRNGLAADEEIDPNELRRQEDDLKVEVENIVEPLLPELSLGEDELKQVTVSFFHDLPQAPIEPPSLASNAMAWTSQYANTLVMAGLGVFSLIMLRSMVNSGADSGPAESAALRVDSGERSAGAASDGGGSGGGEEGDERPKLTLRKPETLKDDLAEMVAGDPDAAAAILRSWINNNEVA